MKLEHIETYSWCQHDINWIAYYKYFEKYGLLPNDKNFDIFDIWYNLACSCGWCYTFENMVFVCEKPSELSLNEQGKLHKDGDMALKYSDGYGLYMLNGIRVSKELAITPAEKLDIKLFMKEQNADIKAEFIRKYGIERMLSLGKIVDTYKNYNEHWWIKSEYELWDMHSVYKEFTKHEKCMFLKMKNLTMGIWHLEGVHPSCNTLAEALKWRMNNNTNKIKAIA